MRRGGILVILAAIAGCPRATVTAPAPDVVDLGDLGTVEMVVQLGHAGPITDARFSPDARLVATGSYDRTVKVWDTATGKLIRTLDGHPSTTAHVWFLDDARLASFDLDGYATVWDLATGARLPNDGAPTLEERLAIPVGVDAPAPVPLMARSADGRLGLFEVPEPPRPEPDVPGNVELGVSYIGPGDPALARLRPLGVWNLALGGQVATINGLTHMMVDASFAPAAGRAIAVGDDYAVAWWDLDAAKLIRPVASGSYQGTLLPDGARALLHDDFRLPWQLWDLDAGRALRPYPENYAMPLGQLPGLTIAADDVDSNCGLSGPADDARMICTHAFDLWDDATGALVLRSDAGPPPTAVATSSDGRRILSTSGDRTLRLWDAATATLIRELQVAEPTLAIALSPDGSRALVAARDLTVVDTQTGGVVDTLTGDAGEITTLAFSPDGSQAASGAADGTVQLWDLAGARALRTFRGHGGAVLELGFRRDGRFVHSAATDGTIKVWSVDRDDVLTLASSGSEWIAFTQDGLFDASRRGGELVAMVQGTRAFGVEQFAVRNNRPDVIFERFGLGDDATIEHYRRQVARRQRRAGLIAADPGAGLHVPEARIVSATQDGRVVDLAIELADERVDLARYRVFANGVPVAEAAIDGRRATATVAVTLTAGANRLEISASNVAGTESFRAMTSARWDGAPTGDLYFLGFGVSRHRDPRLDLQFAHKDAADLAHLFEGIGAGFAHVHARFFSDAEVTTAALRDAGALIAGAGVDDTVVVFVAGHGVHDDDRDETYYYVTHDTDPARLAATAAPFAMIEELIAGGAARRKLLLLDTCESGDAEDLAAAPAAPGGRALRSRGARGIFRRPVATTRAYLGERDRFVYNDLERRTGAIVLSSSRGGELSYEDDALENGLFTEAVITALTSDAADADHDGRVAVGELTRHVARAVADQSDGRQHPVVDRDNPDQALDLPIAYGLALPPVAAAPLPPAARGARGCACQQGGDASWPVLALLVALLTTRSRPARRSRAGRRP